MAKKPEKVLKDYAKSVSLIDPEKFDFLLDEIPRIIKVRTRLGRGLLGTLKPLSDKYKKFRAKYSNLSSETTAKRSNLTLTGEMLDSIKGTRSGTKFSFFFSNKASNDKARWADETGRPFFDLLPSEEKGLQRRISAIIRKALRDIFKS